MWRLILDRNGRGILIVRGPVYAELICSVALPPCLPSTSSQPAGRSGTDRHLLHRFGEGVVSITEVRMAFESHRSIEAEMTPKQRVVVRRVHQLLDSIFHNVSLAISESNLAANRAKQGSHVI